GFPSGIAAVATVIIIASMLTAGALALAPSMSDWIARAPQIVQSVERKIRPIMQQFAPVENVSNQIAQVTAPKSTTPGVVVSEGLVTSAVKIAPEIIAKSIFVAVLTIFLLALRRRYTEQLVLLPRNFCNRIRLARIARDVRHRVSGYLFTLT